VKSRLLFNIKNHCHNLKSFFPTKVQPCQTSVNTSSRRRLRSSSEPPRGIASRAVAEAVPLWGGGTALFCSFLPKQLALHRLSAQLSHTQPHSAILSNTQLYSAILSYTQTTDYNKRERLHK
ncbi:MAG: hypothetical protein R3Y61_08280, partial [Rikenellaceae bacterium]